MELLHPRCSSIDVHKKMLAVNVRIAGPKGTCSSETRKFGTFTQDLLAVSDWLQESGVTHVVMESTGSYWRPVYNILEGNFEILVVNAHHVKNVPGRKTDVKDAEWLSDLLAHGLLNASFVPEPSLRALRDLTRGRTMLVRQRASLSNRIQKLLEEANIKLGSVASDVLGMSGRDMLREIANGQTDTAILADLARGKLRSKIEDLKKALEGRIQPHQRVLLKELLAQVEHLGTSILNLEHEIEVQIKEQMSDPFESAVALAQGIPGIAENSARIILSEIGVDMERFGSADRLCAWSGAAPGNRQSAGKRLPGGRRHGNRYLLTCLAECAASAIRNKSNYYYALFKRIARRRGGKKAVIAVAHSMLRSLYAMIRTGTPYHELGTNHFEKRDQEKIVERLKKRLVDFGYAVTLSQEVVQTTA